MGGEGAKLRQGHVSRREPSNAAGKSQLGSQKGLVAQGQALPAGGSLGRCTCLCTFGSTLLLSFPISKQALGAASFLYCLRHASVPGLLGTFSGRRTLWARPDDSTCVVCGVEVPSEILVSNITPC